MKSYWNDNCITVWIFVLSQKTKKLWPNDGDQKVENYSWATLNPAVSETKKTLMKICTFNHLICEILCEKNLEKRKWGFFVMLLSWEWRKMSQNGYRNRIFFSQNIHTIMKSYWSDNYHTVKILFYNIMKSYWNDNCKTVWIFVLSQKNKKLWPNDDDKKVGMVGQHWTPLSLKRKKTPS